MKTDSLARRIRSEPPSPVSKRVVINEAEYLIFEAINRHGPLPTHFLFEFVRPIRRNYANFQYRLTQLYNGDGDGGGPYLIRPPQQFAGYEARYQHMVYDLAPRAKRALAERGTLARLSPKRIDPFLHQFMGASVASSMELAAGEAGIRYIPREEILTHERCPEATRQAPNPLAIPVPSIGERKSVVPDDVFGLEYPGGGFRFFAVEIDRNTESIERKRVEQNSIGRKIAGYLEIMRHQAFREHFGLPNLSVLIVTTNVTHGLNILEYLRRQGVTQYEGRFAVSCYPDFGVNWRVPKTVLADIIAEPWTTLSGPKYIGKP